MSRRPVIYCFTTLNVLAWLWLQTRATPWPLKMYLCYPTVSTDYCNPLFASSSLVRSQVKSSDQVWSLSGFYSGWNIRHLFSKCCSFFRRECLFSFYIWRLQPIFHLNLRSFLSVGHFKSFQWGWMPTQNMHVGTTLETEPCTPQAKAKSKPMWPNSNVSSNEENRKDQKVWKIKWENTIG